MPARDAGAYWGYVRYGETRGQPASFVPLVWPLARRDDSFERLPHTDNLRNVTGPSGLQIEPPRFGAALPSPITSSPLRVSRPRLTSDAAYPQLAPVLDSSTHLRQYFSRPGYYFLTPGQFSDHAVEPRSYGLLASGPVGHGSPPTRLAALVDASQVQARATFPAGDLRMGPLVALGDRYFYVGGTLTGVSDHILRNLNAGLIVWRNSLGLTARVAHINLATGAFGMVGGSLSRGMERKLTDLGAYADADADAMAASLGRHRGTVLRRVAYLRRRGISGSVLGGAGHILCAVQGRLALSRREELLLHTHITQRRARALLCNGHGIRGHLRSTGMTWAVRREPMHLPHAKLPQSLALGDERVRTVSKTGILGVSLGSLAVWLGTQFIRQSDREVRVRRLGESCFELCCTPTRIYGVGLFLASALGLQISWDISRAHCLRQSFTYRTADSRVHRLLVRGMATGRVGDVARSERNAAPHRLLVQQYYAHRPQRLPRGISRGYSHAIEASERRLGGGLHLYAWPRQWLPKGWAPGLTCHRIVGKERQAIEQNEQLVVLNSRGAEIRSELFWRGVRSERVAATTYRAAAQRGALVLQQLHFDCVIARSRQPLRSTNKQIINRLNRYFDLQLDAMRPPVSRRRREVALGRVICVQELSRAVPTEPIQTVAGFMRQCNAAHKSGLALRHIHKLTHKLRYEASVDGCSLVIQRFVQRRALRGFTAMHVLLGGGVKTLSLDSTTQSYTDAIAHGAKTQLRFGRGAADGRAIAKVLAALSRIGRAHIKLYADPLTAPQRRGQLIKQLREVRQSLSLTLAPRSAANAITARR